MLEAPYLLAHLFEFLTEAVKTSSVFGKKIK